MKRMTEGRDADWAFSFRDFGRMFTRRAGLLREAPYDPGLSLLESRIIFELAQSKRLRSKDIVDRLGVDKGYLSRVVAALSRRGVVKAASNSADGRERWLALAPRGRELFARINRVSEQRAWEVLESLGRLRATELIRHLRTATLLLGSERLRPTEIRLRRPGPGDQGWVIARHGEIYHDEFGWNEEFETLVADIVAAFAKSHDPTRERAWIAEARGVRLGCVFLVREDDETAKLRILLVEPVARGAGIGTLLVKECVRFAKASGYRRIVLWTNSALASARRIYEAEGFKLDREERHHSFGKDLVGQFWAKELMDQARITTQVPTRAS